MRRGQSTVEWMLLVAVITVGLVAAAYAFLPGFSQGVDGLESDLGNLFAQGERDGSGDAR
ncbi:MAG: hypothetical protein FJ102_10375 [Deltaproteobacteria bacterium]|nr:hypothetical protein [Deltaproteobacteria bacterium]